MTTPCGYYVDASDLTVVFKGYLYGKKQQDSGFNSTSYSGQDISQLFQPATSSSQQIDYNTNIISSNLGGFDLKNYFMDIDYPVVQLTVSGFDTTLSVFTSSGSGSAQTITDTTGVIVFSTTGSSTGSLTVTNFPSTAILYFMVVGGGGGGGGGGGQATSTAYHAGSGGGGGGGNFNTGVLTSGNTYSISIGVGGGSGSGGDSSFPKGKNGAEGGTGGITSCGSNIATGGNGGGGGSGGSDDAPFYGNGGGGGNGTGNGGSGDSGINDTGGSEGSQISSTGYVEYTTINSSYNVFYGGGGGGGSTSKDFGGTGYYPGGYNSGGIGGASANSSAQQQRAGYSGQTELSSWSSFTPVMNLLNGNYAPYNLTGICIGGGGGGGSGGNDSGQAGFNGGQGAQGIAIIWWDASL